jgi:zinc-ribbon domain
MILTNMRMEFRSWQFLWFGLPYASLQVRLPVRKGALPLVSFSSRCFSAPWGRNYRGLHSISVSEEVKKLQVASGEGKKCPYCAEIIKSEARVCRFCGRDLPTVQQAPRCSVVASLFLNPVTVRNYLKGAQQSSQFQNRVLNQFETIEGRSKSSKRFQYGPDNLPAYQRCCRTDSPIETMIVRRGNTSRNSRNGTFRGGPTI